MFQLVDGHCDTIVKIMKDGEELLKNEKQVDLIRLKQYGTPVQLFAIWLEPFFYPIALRQTLKYIDFYYQQVQKNKTMIRHCNSYKDIEKNKREGKISGILTLEGGEALEGEISMVRMFYQLGVRGITLTWNHRNQLGDGVEEKETKGGLTRFGKEVVQEMNRLGMLIDVSHLSEPGFWDVAKITRKPFLATHSNAQAICNHKRNLTEMQMKAIAEKGGIIGLNLYPPFLIKNKKATIEDCLNQIAFMIRVVGTDYIGLGCDFDGIDATPQGLEEISKLDNLANEIGKKFGEETAEKIMGKNFSRVLKEILQ